VYIVHQSPLITHLPRLFATARAEGQNAPRRAPAWWGCPRGPRCEFAHGEEELLGDSKKIFAEQRREERRDAERQKKDTYLGAVECNQSSEEMASAVAAGLGRAAKKTRKGQAEAGSTQEVAHDREVGSGEATSSSALLLSHATGVEMVKSPTEEKEEEDAAASRLPPVWLHPATSASSAVTLHAGGVMECTLGFGTVLVDGMEREQGTAQGKERADTLRWYYEVELITGGLMQVSDGRIKQNEFVVERSIRDT
jgi:hypothetical protein